MTTISVNARQALRIVDAVERGLYDWQDSFRFWAESTLRETQQDWARNASWGPGPLWGAGRPLSDSSRYARREREGYYRNPPAPDATQSSILYWTGKLAEATATITSTSPLLAVIDTQESYFGPIRDFADPVSAIVQEIHGGVVWEPNLIEKDAEKLAEMHAQASITSAVRRAAA